MQPLIGRTEKQLILQRCKRQNWKYYTTEDVTCPTVDAFPVRYYFTHLIFWQKHHKKHLHTTFVFRPNTFFPFMSQARWTRRSLSHLIIPSRSFFYFKPHCGSRCFHWRTRGNSVLPHVHPTSEKTCSILHTGGAARCRAAFLAHLEWQKQRDVALLSVWAGFGLGLFVCF